MWHFSLCTASKTCGPWICNQPVVLVVFCYYCCQWTQWNAGLCRTDSPESWLTWDKINVTRRNIIIFCLKLQYGSVKKLWGFLWAIFWCETCIVSLAVSFNSIFWISMVFLDSYCYMAGECVNWVGCDTKPQYQQPSFNPERLGKLSACNFSVNDEVRDLHLWVSRLEVT